VEESTLTRLVLVEGATGSVEPAVRQDSMLAMTCLMRV
jgi:hypothetical protein